MALDQRPFETADEAMARNTAAFIRRLRDVLDPDRAVMHNEAHALRLVREKQDG